MPVPDITGQPAWVVIVVMLLTASATLGVAYLANRRKSTNKEEGEQVRLSSSEHDPTVLVMRAALDHLARVADRESAEHAEAREEVTALRLRLEDQLREVLDLRNHLAETREALSRCQARAELLSEQALRKRSHD